jgi:hypothetical protein
MEVTMPEFHEVRIRIRDEKLGQFSRDLNIKIPYAKIVGMEPIGHVTIDLNSEPKLIEPPRKGKRRISGFTLSNAQRRAYAAVQAGNQTLETIQAVAGFRKPWWAKRALNNLKKHHLVIGVEGSYRLPKGEVNNG